MLAAGIDLPDLNVWLAASLPDHAHHARAARYWREEAADRVVFCRVTSLGFLRLCTNQTVMGGNPLTVQQAWDAYNAFSRLPEVVFLAEPDALEPILGGWAAGGVFTGRHWTDAYLAAFARAEDLRVVSFDRDFSRFPDIRFLQLIS